MSNRKLWVLALVLAGGCVTKGEGEKLWTEIRAMQAQNNEISASLNRNKTQLVRLMRSADQKVADLNKKIEQAENILRRSNVDFFKQIQQLQKEVSSMSGRVERAERNIDVHRRDLETFRGETKSLLAKATQQKTPAQMLPEDPQQAFDMAAGSLGRGDYYRATEFYLALLKKFPQHPRMADVQFGLAEAYYGKRDWRHALAEYSRFYQDYQSNPKAAEALYKVARCYERIGDFRTAILSLKVITKKFKESTFARDAKRLMKDLKKRI